MDYPEKPSNAVQRRASQSPSSYRNSESLERRFSISDQVSSISARLSTLLAATRDGDEKTDTNSSRSVSRGRDAFQSSGRGGIGNIRRSSISIDGRRADGPDDLSPVRGRERATPDRPVYSVGRGGAGNIRSPSHDVGAEHPHTASIISEHAAVNAGYEDHIRKIHAENNNVRSSGRGGLGNINNKPASRSRSKGQTMHSSGRGGVGNIHFGDGNNADLVDAEERRRHAHSEGLHSTGRGGIANLTSSHGPSLEIHSHNTSGCESSGRGGAGNIRSRSTSRDINKQRAASMEKHGISALWNKHTASPLSHPGVDVDGGTVPNRQE